MPLLSKRRSLIDLLNTAGDGEERPKTSSLLPPRPYNEDERPRSEYGYSRSRLSHEVLRDELPEPKDSQDSVSTRAKRFSLMKLRNYSESHLATRAKEAERREVQHVPPVPEVPTSAGVPTIMRTAPTMDHGAVEQEEAEQPQERERRLRPSLFKRSMSKGRTVSPAKEPRKSMDEKRGDKKASSLRWRRLQGRSTGLEDLQRMAAAQVASHQLAPPSYGDESSSALALPVHDPRFSESSRSDGSNNSSEEIYGQTTTTHTVSTHTTFFKIPRRNKNRNSLFPLPVRIPPPDEDVQQDGPETPRASTGANPNTDGPYGGTRDLLQRRHTESSPTKQLPPNAALARGALSFAEPGGMSLFRNESQRSRASSNSSPLQPPRRLGLRDRASTTSSFGRSSHDMGTPPPMPGSGRNSTSTTGRTSLSGLLTLSRFRQSSDPNSPRHGSPGANSKSNSFAMSREALVVPEREEGDTPGKYLERLQAAVSRSMIAGILSQSADPFAQAVLRSYTRRFPFFGEPIDMSLRKFLLEADLPKETQQVDRVIQAFADRYHECNPGIFVSPDQAYIIAFSLMMLHTDAFNKNNKRKMQKQDYIRNTSGQDVSDDVLACFYDNICYTPFVHYEEETDINGEPMLHFPPTGKKSKVKTVINENNKKPSGPVDPYNLLVEQKLDLLRPNIKDEINMDDPYNYRAPTQEMDPDYLQRAFTHTGTLQIISQHSRPSAYEGNFTNGEGPNLIDMKPGIIDIKITKVGTLWRKATKKKKARSPWQEWGAILTGSQLYLFKNAHWARGLVHQFNSAQERGRPRTPVTFKPPLQEFKPDALVKTDNAVALIDSTYTRHKHAFVFIGPSGQDEVFLADSDSELNDWLALINYAAAFRSAGVRIRGMVGGAEEDTRSKEVRRLESGRSTQSASSDLAQNRVLSPQLQRQVMAARRQIMVQKVAEMSREIAEANKELDSMLRNARHLLILAPIAPRTREAVVHAVASANASLTWRRRNTWRLRCYKDILAMDVRLDGVTAAEIQALAEQQAVEAPPPESAKKAWPMSLVRLTSRASARGQAQGHSPTSPTFFKRPSTTGSLEAYTNDIFRTPTETSATQQQSGEWSLPPLQLDVQQSTDNQHRGSVSSALLSTSSQGRNSVSQASTNSSIPDRINSDTTEHTTPRARAPSSVVFDPEVEKLARASVTPEPLGLDGAASTAASPDSTGKQRTGVRRSLQKTLRDSHNHHHSSIHHKHRRGKESDSTVRSANGQPAASLSERDNETAIEEGTPGLVREKRFVLHGKQASVVQFGAEWPNDRMRARREAWRGNSANAVPTVAGARRDSDALGIVRGDLRGKEQALPLYAEEGVSPGDEGLVRDVLVAEAFAENGESAAGDSDSDTLEEGLQDAGPAYFDAESGEDDDGRSKRETVIGPSLPRTQERKAEPNGGANDDGDDEELSPTRKPKRTTVIGPSQPVLPSSSATAAHGNKDATAGAEQPDQQHGGEEDDHDSNDEEYTTPPSSGPNSTDEAREDVVGQEGAVFRTTSAGVIEVR